MLGKLFRRRKAHTEKPEEPKRDKTLVAAEKVIEEFGAVPVTPGTVQDVSVLPHGKDRIKAALLTVLDLGEDQSQREFLKICYLSLADFQDGVDAKTGPTTDDDGSTLVDISEAREYWRNKSRDEHDQLLAELNEKGFGEAPNQLEGRQI